MIRQFQNSSHLIHKALLLLAMSCATQWGHAADFTIVSGQTETTTQTLNDNESGTVQNGGEISTTTDNTHAIDGNDDDTVVNNGTLSTTGDNSDAIDLEDNSTVTNNGTITTSGEIADGIDVDDDSTIINNGTITITGDEDGGGNYPSGIEADERNTITNNGTINTSGTRSPGIMTFDGDNNTIINDGTITTTGNSSGGIVVRDDGNITNTGTINTSGASAEGIFAYDDNTITNSGTVISQQSDAFRIVGDRNTVNLLGGTHIEGALLLEETTNTFNYGNGLNSAFTFSKELPGTIETNGMPTATQNKLVATVDTTGYAMADEITSDISDCGHNGIKRRLSIARNQPGESNSWSSLCSNYRHQESSGHA